MKKTKLVSLLLIAITLGVTSCKKDKKAEEVTPDPTPVAPSINSSAQTSFSLNGATITYKASTPDFYASYGYSGSSSGSSMKKSYDSYVGLFNDIGLTIEKGDITIPSGSTMPSNTVFANFFQAGTYTYASTSVSDGFAVVYNDGTELWTSKLGDQTGSVIKIVESRNEATSPNFTMKTYITFNCKIYSISTGAMKTITNGIFINEFANY